MQISGYAGRLAIGAALAGAFLIILLTWSSAAGESGDGVINGDPLTPTQLPTGTPCGDCPSMSIHVDGEFNGTPVACDSTSGTFENPTKCTLDNGSSFTLDIQAETIPAVGYGAWQTLLFYDSLLWKPQSLAAEIVWPDHGSQSLAGRVPNVATGKERLVQHGDTTSPFVSPPKSNATGALVRLSMNCQTNGGLPDGHSHRLIIFPFIHPHPVTTIPPGLPKGSGYNGAAGSTFAEPEFGSNRPVSINGFLSLDVDGDTELDRELIHKATPTPPNVGKLITYPIHSIMEITCGAAPTATATVTGTPTPTSTPTVTNTLEPGVTPSVTPTPSTTPTASPTATTTSTPPPTDTPQASATPIPTAVPPTVAPPTTAPTATLTPTVPLPTPTEPSLVENNSGTVPAGGMLTTDTEGDGATADDQVETSVTVPAGGPVSISEKPTTNPNPAGFALLGLQVNITAPASTSQNPLVIVFTLDASIIPEGEDENTIQLFRDGIPVPDCAVPATGKADPDPCIAKRHRLVGPADNDVQLSVLTSAASSWNFGGPPEPPPDLQLGDVDGSGEVNSLDALWVLLEISGSVASVPFPTVGDVDGDGLISPVDALLILQHDAGLIDSFPAATMASSTVWARLLGLW